MANATYQIGFIADTTQLKKQLNETLSLLKSVGEQGLLKKDLSEAAQSALELREILKGAINQNTGQLNIAAFGNNLKKGQIDLKEYAKQFEKLGTDGTRAFLQVARSIITAEDPLRRTNKILDELWTNLKRVATYQISYKTLNLFTGTLRTAYQYSQDLNDSLNKIRIVTQNSTEEMAVFQQKANDAAKALSTTTIAYTDAALIYAQQGLDADEMTTRTEATIKMSQASGDSAQEVSSYMTAIWNNFDDGSKSLEYFGDVMTKLGANTASSTSEIAQGLERFAASSKTIGLSYEYATASLSTLIAETRRSADTVGTSLNTIFSRLQGLKLGEELDDGTDLNKYSKALETVGVQIKDVNGGIKNMDQILDELGAKWRTLEKDQQIALAQTVAGEIINARIKYFLIAGSSLEL